ncbi:MAG: hypothetical protein PHE02_02635 [Lachnospiraceae bacterium]|nr:hypothetical protein [Lachnospiraceae bacterium]
MQSEEKYMVKEVVDITEIDYSEYGILYNMSGEGKDTGNTNRSSGNGWEDVDTSIPVLDTLGTLGYTYSEGQPFLTVEMEKHSHTQEAQIPIEQPICLLIAKACKGAPRAEDTVAVRIRPGYIFVLHRETWHSASHGTKHAGRYHWMAQVYKNEPTVWKEIQGGAVYVKDNETE